MEHQSFDPKDDIAPANRDTSEPDGWGDCDQKEYQRSRVTTRRARDGKARKQHRARLETCPSDIELPPQVNGPMHGNEAASLSHPADQQAASAIAAAWLGRAARPNLACVACDTPASVPQGQAVPKERARSARRAHGKSR